MALGDVYKESLLAVETRTVKTGETVTRGDLVSDDGSGNGIVVCTAVLAASNKVMVALEDGAADEEIECAVVGYVEVAKATGTAIVNGNIVEATAAGEITVGAGTDALVACGTAMEDAASADTSVKILLGVY